jgi:hypothetical protein
LLRLPELRWDLAGIAGRLSGRLNVSRLTCGEWRNF